MARLADTAPSGENSIGSVVQNEGARIFFSDFLSRQFARPEGMVGRFLMGMYFNRVNAAGNTLVFDALCARDGEIIAEIGFGGGQLLLSLCQHYRHATVHGVELSDELLARMRAVQQRSGPDNLELHAGSVESLPFADDSLDAIASVNTVYFWPSLNSGFVELARVLKPGGRLVLGYGSAQHLAQRGYRQRGFALHSPAELSAAASACGLQEDALFSVERGGRGPFIAQRLVKPG